MARRWSDDLILKFVTLYEGEPDLWDSSSENYKNKHAREAALERIVSGMELEGFTTKDCKIKIKNIRSHIGRKFKKLTTA
jgi:hypothetical protein